MKTVFRETGLLEKTLQLRNLVPSLDPPARNMAGEGDMRWAPLPTSTEAALRQEGIIGKKEVQSIVEDAPNQHHSGKPLLKVTSHPNALWEESAIWSPFAPRCVRC